MMKTAKAPLQGAVSGRMQRSEFWILDLWQQGACKGFADERCLRTKFVTRPTRMTFATFGSDRGPTCETL